MAANFNIQGLSEVDQALRELPAKLQADVLRRTNRSILNRLVRPQLRQLPYRRKRISAVGVREDKTAVMIGVSSKNYWLRFLDKGTRQRQTRAGHNRGAITGNNRIRDVVQGSVRPVLNEVDSSYSEMVIKTLRSRIRSVNKRIAKL